MKQLKQMLCRILVGIVLFSVQGFSESLKESNLKRQFSHTNAVVVSSRKKHKNTPFNLYALEGKEKGPTLLVIGGIHGDEPGSYFAPALLAQYYTITKGNVLVVPNLNPDSIMAFRRGLYKDMNRKFAVIAKDDPDFENVERIKGIIKDSKVDFIINLHDGHGFYREKWENSIFNPKAWGQTYVIDQKTLDNVPFGDLDKIAKQMEAHLNQTLHYDFHTFGVRNTETKFKDEEQQNSLTFFATTHLKPALAIETSKNIKELPLKTLYQLSSIEVLMDILGIDFERHFDLDLENVTHKINAFGSVKINDNITLELSGIKNSLNFVPLLKEENSFVFTNPIAGAKRVKDGFELYVGYKKAGHLRAEIFPMDCKMQSLGVELDGREVQAKAGDVLEFRENFLIKEQENARVNVIGYSKKGLASEHNILLTPKMMDKNYTLDKAGRIFRVEWYEGENFCGMLNLCVKE